MRVWKVYFQISLEKNFVFFVTRRAFMASDFFFFLVEFMACDFDIWLSQFPRKT